MIPKSMSSTPIGDGNRFSEKIMPMLRKAEAGRAGAAAGTSLPQHKSERAMKRFMIGAAALALMLGTGTGGAGAQEKLKVGYIYVGPVGDMGYSYQHDVG